MKRTTIYLPESLKTRLEELAATRRVTEAELIRTAVAAFLADQEPPAPRLPLYDSGDPGLARAVAERPEEVLRGFGER